MNTANDAAAISSSWKMEWNRLKEAIIEALRDHMSKGANGLTSKIYVEVYGSTASGFGENADVDATVMVAGREAVHQKVQVLQVLAEALPHLLPSINVSEKVFAARVPILKLRGSGIDFDLSVNNTMPLFNTKLLKGYADIHPEIRPYRHCYQSCFGCIPSWNPTPCSFKLGMHAATEMNK